MTKTILVFGDSNTFGTPPMLSRDGNMRAIRKKYTLANDNAKLS